MNLKNDSDIPNASDEINKNKEFNPYFFTFTVLLTVFPP